MRKNKIRLNEGNSPIIYLLGLLTSFIIHSTSTQFWGYDMFFSQIPKIMFFGFLFSSVNIITLDKNINKSLNDLS